MWLHLFPRRRTERPEALPAATQLVELCIERPLARGALLAPLLAKSPADRPSDAGQWAARAHLAVQRLDAPRAAQTPK